MTSELLTPLSWRIRGASVCGPGNRARGVTNQDAWLRVSRRGLNAIVVCDGMGSAPQAALGARCAALAARDALALWAGTADADPARLPGVVRAGWRLRLGHVSPERAATTVAFVGVAPDHRLVLGRLGDGLTVIIGDDGAAECIAGRGAGFSNETSALGAGDGRANWFIEQRELPAQASRAFVLMTDGVSDDIAEGSEFDFTRALLKVLNRGSAALVGELRGWPVAHHTDDKTIVAMWSGQADAGERYV